LPHILNYQFPHWSFVSFDRIWFVVGKIFAHVLLIVIVNGGVDMFKSVDYNKAPLQSKKFLAYMFSNIVLKTYIFHATLRQESDFVIIAALLCSVFLDVGYILGQASLDKFVRVAAITTGKDPPKD